MKIRSLLCGLLMLVFAGGIASAQDLSDPLRPVKIDEVIYFGLSGGYNKVMHNVEMKTFAYDVLCPVFEDGRENGYHLGGFYEQMIGEAGTAHSIVLRALYNTYNSSFEKQGDRLLSRVTDANGNESDVYTTTNHKNEIKYAAFSLDLMYKFRALMFPNLGALVFTAGPTVDFIGTKTRTQTMNLVDPSNVQFREQPLPEGQRYSADRRSVIVYDGDIDGAKSMRIGMKVGAQLEIKIPNLPIDIIPGAFYNFALTNVDDQDWKVNTIQIGVDIRYALKY